VVAHHTTAVSELQRNTINCKLQTTHDTLQNTHFIRNYITKKKEYVL